MNGVLSLSLPGERVRSIPDLLLSVMLCDLEQYNENPNALRHIRVA